MKDYIINDRIRLKEVRLIDEKGAQLGVVSTPEALKLARERGFDLVLVSPGAVPPVCRIAEYGKLRYELHKKEKEARKSQHAGVVKEIKLSSKIAQHDFDVRVNKAKEFLAKKHKVKVTLYFKGREMQHIDYGRRVVDRMTEALAEAGKVEEAPRILGKNMFVMVTPK